MSPVFMCYSVFDMDTTLFKVALFPSSYNLMRANIMTIVLLLLLLLLVVVVVVVVFYPLPQCKWQQLESDFGCPCILGT
jgi:uncharacterized membrane protein